MRRQARRVAAALVMLGVMATPLHAATYVVQAAAWGPAQDHAVAVAGGTVTQSHPRGLAVVESDRADFRTVLLASGSVTHATEDREIRFRGETVVGEVELTEAAEEALPHPITDTYYPILQWSLHAIRAPQAWALGYTGRGVRVAIVDSAVYGNHIDLRANVDRAAGRSFATGRADGCREVWDCDVAGFWHGTFVAGIVAAAANGRGVVGIAPEATIVPVKVLHNDRGGFSGVILGILYAATEGRADIINLSLGTVVPRNDPAMMELVHALTRAIHTAQDNGVLVVSSAGNDALDLDHSGNLIKIPAEIASTVVASATGPLGFGFGATDFGRIASYTNHGASLVTLAAPGGDFMLQSDARCPVPLGSAGTLVNFRCQQLDMVASTTRLGWSHAVGTSLSSPAVAAVAALIKQKHPDMPLGALKNALRRASDDLGKPGHDAYYGTGFLNAEKAVR